MEDSLVQQDIDVYTEALATAPEEVRAFLWSDTYKKILDMTAENFALTPAQKQVVNNLFIDGVINQTTESEAVKMLTDAGIAPDVQSSILEIGYQYIFETALAATQETVEGEQHIEQPEEIPLELEAPHAASVAPSPTEEALASIQARLQQPVATPPVTRSYSLDTQRSTAPTTPSTQPPTIDPYKEPIE